MKNRLHGVAVTKQGIRPFLNDGHNGVLQSTEPSASSPLNTNACRPHIGGGYVFVVYEKNKD